MVYKGTNETYDFRNFKTIRAFGNEIRNNIISLDTANLEQANLLTYISDFMGKTKPRNPEKRKLRSDVLDRVTSLVTEEKWYLLHLKAEYFRCLKNRKRAKEQMKVNELKY